MGRDWCGVVLQWVGDRYCHHSAARCNFETSSDDMLGALHGCFRSQAPEGRSAVAKRTNAFKGKVGEDSVMGAANLRTITLSPDQDTVLRFINSSDSPVLVVHALAGTGKSTVAEIILESYLRTMPKGEAVAILVPSRTLRDDHALDADYGVGNAINTALGKDKSGTRAAPSKASMCTRVLWLGRPADDNTSTMCDGQVSKLTQEALAEPLG